MKLVFVTQRVDPDDEALGATVPMLRALAGRVDELVVASLASRDAGLPANVRLRSIAAPTQALRGARLAAVLADELRSRPAAVVAHMAPIYAVLAAPVARPLRVPILMWFTHWRDSRLLRLAERAASRVLTVDETSFPFASAKVVALGHAIDVDAFPVVSRGGDGTLRLLALGRTSPAKGLATLVEAVGRLDGLPVALDIRGPSLTQAESEHRRELEQLVAGRGLEGRVTVGGGVPRHEIPQVYASVDALVNNMRAGALDKVVFEAAGSALPVVVASPGFDALVGGISPPLRFVQDDADGLAARVRGLHEAGRDARQAAGAELRERVRRDHSVEHWAEGVLASIP